MRKIKRVWKTIPIFFSELVGDDSEFASFIILIFLTTALIAAVIFTGFIFGILLVAITIASSKGIHWNDFLIGDFPPMGICFISLLAIGGYTAEALVNLKRNFCRIWINAWDKTSAKAIAERLMK